MNDDTLWGLDLLADQAPPVQFSKYEDRWYIKGRSLRPEQVALARKADGDVVPVLVGKLAYDCPDNDVLAVFYRLGSREPALVALLQRAEVVGAAERLRRRQVEQVRALDAVKALN